MVTRLGLVPPIPRLTIDSIFHNGNTDRRRDRMFGGDDGSETSLSLFELFEALISAGDFAFGMDYTSTNERFTPLESFEKVCHERFEPLAAEMGYERMRSLLRSRPLHVCLAAQVTALEAVHTFYSVSTAEPKRRGRLAKVLTARIDAEAAESRRAYASAGLFLPNASRHASGTIGTPSVSIPAALRPKVEAGLAEADARGGRGSDGRGDGFVPLAGFLELLEHAGLFVPGCAAGGTAAKDDGTMVDIAPYVADSSGLRRQVFRGNAPPSSLFPGVAALSRREAVRCYYGALGVPLPGEALAPGLSLPQLLEALARAAVAKWGPVAGLGMSWVAEMGALEVDAFRAVLGRDVALARGDVAPPPPPHVAEFEAALQEQVLVHGDGASDAPDESAPAALLPFAPIAPCPPEHVATVASVLIGWSLMTAAAVAQHFGCPADPEMVRRVQSFDAAGLPAAAAASENRDHFLRTALLSLPAGGAGKAAPALAALDPKTAPLPERRNRAWKPVAALPATVLSASRMVPVTVVVPRTSAEKAAAALAAAAALPGGSPSSPTSKPEGVPVPAAS